MGDMNDTPGTPVIRRLRGLDDIWGDFIQVANEVPADDRFTFIFNGTENLLDHILLSPSLYQEFRAVPLGQRAQIVDLGSWSDHRGVLARIRLR